jgi:hypothetical protein
MMKRLEQDQNQLCFLFEIELAVLADGPARDNGCNNQGQIDKRRALADQQARCRRGWLG